MVPTENWHLTLRFLGETSTGQLDTVRRDLRSANLGRAFVLVFTGLGAFPSAGRARVLWLGTSAGADSLGSLAAAVEGVVGAAGFPPEARPFKAHLTLGRMNPEADVRDVIRCVRPIDLPAAVDRVVVYRSHLSPRGASYEVVDTVALPEATDGANL
jgi:2'-5' RNA ligase